MDNSTFYFFFYGISVVSILGIIFVWVSSLVKGGSSANNSEEVKHHQYFSSHPNNPNRNFSNHPHSFGIDNK